MREAGSNTSVLSLWNMYPQLMVYTPAEITATIAATGCTATSAMLVHRKAPSNQCPVVKGAEWPFSEAQCSVVLI